MVKDVIQYIKVCFSVVGALLGAFLGGLDGFMIALIVFVCGDYLTGAIAAVVNKELSSAVGFRGILKKIAVFLLVGLANVVDMQVLKAPGVLRMAVIFYYISNEGISILENYTRMGLPVPEQLKTVLIQLKKEPENPAEEEKDYDDEDRT